MLRLLLFPLLVCGALVAGLSAQEGEVHPQVVLKTNQGEITLQLDGQRAPRSTENFLRYVREGHYNGTVFHRVIGDFMIQGGGFELKEGLLMERETREPITNEGGNGLRNEKMTVAMARTGELHSATSQFFINLADNDFLDNPQSPYAVFGKVVKGQEVVEKIGRARTGADKLHKPMPGGELAALPAGDVPVEVVVIEEARVLGEGGEKEQSKGAGQE